MFFLPLNNLCFIGEQHHQECHCSIVFRRCLSEETLFLLALLLKRRPFLALLLFSHLLLPCRLKCLSDKLLSRVLGHMPASGATDRPERKVPNQARRFMPQKHFSVTIANGNACTSTFGAGRWLLCLIVHIVCLAFLTTLVVLLHPPLLLLGAVRLPNVRKTRFGSSRS